MLNRKTEKKNSVIGENAAQRIVRLLREFSQQTLKYPENESISLYVESNGSGQVLYNDIDTSTTTIMQFQDFSELEEFLTGSSLDRLVWASRVQR